jgi:hypothetical protein
MRWFAALPLAILPLAAGAASPTERADLTYPGRDISPSVSDRCDPIRNVRRTDTPAGATAQRLIDLPPGNLDLAVMRQLNNCPEPVTIREGYGAVEGPRAAKQPRVPVRPKARLLGR